MVTKKKTILSLVFCILLLVGCGSKDPIVMNEAPRVDPVEVEHFEQQIDELVSRVVVTQYGTKGEFAPVTVIPGAIKYGSAYTHLEEVIADSLKKKLQTSNEIYEFTSQNWFEYREGRSLSFWKNPSRDRVFLRQLKVFEVRINPEPVFARADVEIVVFDAEGHQLQGQRAGITLDFSPSSPAAQLNEQQINRTPFPEGIEERPFSSIDRFAFSLVGNLTDTYQAGVLGAGRQVSGNDVQVVLSVSPTTLVPKRTIDSIVKALQHAIIQAKGMTCVLSPADGSLHEKDVAQGTVLLVVDFDRPFRSEMISVAMRGVWRVSPLETASGSIVDADLTGTYLSGFTAKAYLQLQGHLGEKSDFRGQRVPRADTVSRSNITVCFYGADEVLKGASYKALRHIPSVEQIRWQECREDFCGCWSMTSADSVSGVEGWLRRYLPQYTDETGYTVRTLNRESIEVLFQD